MAYRRAEGEFFLQVASISECVPIYGEFMAIVEGKSPWLWTFARVNGIRFPEHHKYRAQDCGRNLLKRYAWTVNHGRTWRWAPGLNRTDWNLLVWSYLLQLCSLPVVCKNLSICLPKVSAPRMWSSRWKSMTWMAKCFSAYSEGMQELSNRYLNVMSLWPATSRYAQCLQLLFAYQ